MVLVQRLSQSIKLISTLASNPNGRHKQNAFVNMEVKWRLVNKMYPEIAREISRKVEPIYTDVSKIQQLYKKFPSNEDRLLFVALVLKLYCPGVFYINSEYCRKGLREELALIFGLNHKPQISLLISQAKSYMKVQSFADRVEEIRKEVVR